MNPQADVLIVTDIQISSNAIFEVFKDATGEQAKPELVNGHIYHYLGEINTTRVFIVLSELGKKALNILCAMA